MVVLVAVNIVLVSLYALFGDLLFIGIAITASVTLIVAAVTLDTNEYNPRMITGEPPSQWQFRIGLRKIMGERIGLAQLTNQRDMMGIGPMSRERLDPNYHYRLQEFVNYAGLYRITK